MSQAVIIDDNLKNVNVLTRLLTQEGLSVISISDPLKFDEIEGQLTQSSVVFVDLHMPYVNGYQILEKIKRTPNLKQLPVVAYSVHANELHEAYKQGFDGFLGKPIDSERFPGQLRQILSGEAFWDNP
ncbi:MAG: response regulator [Anaerolineae bacterium]|jgi:CheY-like chemotaxis protein|nr:response regulator [Anaerolineae bacterium]